MTKDRGAPRADENEQPELTPEPETEPAATEARPTADAEPDEETAARAERLEQMLEEPAAAPIVSTSEPGDERTPEQRTQDEKDERTRVTGTEFTAAQVAVLKRVYCKDLTDDEFRVYLAICRRARLDPFQKQIYATKRKDGDTKRMVVLTSIDGYRSIADRTGNYAPGRETEFVGREVTPSNQQGYPYAARAFVKKLTPDGTWHEVVGVAFWDEYFPKNDRDSFMWKKMPLGQLAKCAEALALRRGFPGRFGEVLVDAEMEQAGYHVPLDPSRAIEPAKASAAPRPAVAPATQPARPTETVKRVNADTKATGAAAGMIGAIRRYAIDAGVWDAERLVVNFEFPSVLGVAEPGPYTPQDLAARANASDLVLALRAAASNKKVEPEKPEA